MEAKSLGPSSIGCSFSSLFSGCWERRQAPWLTSGGERCLQYPAGGIFLLPRGPPPKCVSLFQREHREGIYRKQFKSGVCSLPDDQCVLFERVCERHRVGP